MSTECQNEVTYHFQVKRIPKSHLLFKKLVSIQRKKKISRDWSRAELINSKLIFNFSVKNVPKSTQQCKSGPEEKKHAWNIETLHSLIWIIPILLCVCGLRLIVVPFELCFKANKIRFCLIKLPECCIKLIWNGLEHLSDFNFALCIHVWSEEFFPRSLERV